MKRLILTDAEIEQFVERGYIILRGAMPREVASEWVDGGYKRLGYERKDPKTWAKPVIHMPGVTRVNTTEFVPKVWQAVCDLLGGEERVKPYFWDDAFIFNFGHGADQPWKAPSAEAQGWHKDGDFFLHFLDSPEQALLSIVCWTDVLHRGGGTFIATDSVGVVARHLAAHPEGVHPAGPIWQELTKECKVFEELQGEAGDVVLHHPFMLHARSQNVLRVERAISNPPVQLKEPMNLNRADAKEFSALERGVLRGLGLERYDFRPTQPRQKIVPERVRIQAKMLEEEKARLAGKVVA